MAITGHDPNLWVCFHITTRVLGKKFYLRPPEEKKRILHALDFYHRDGRFLLFGFVVMDNHFHALIQPEPGYDISQIMRDFKTWTSGKNNAKPTGSQLWERRFDDNRIQSQIEFQRVLQYIHDNPVRTGIVTMAEHYPWSSVHNYLDDGKEIIEIDMTW